MRFQLQCGNRTWKINTKTITLKFRRGKFSFLLELEAATLVAIIELTIALIGLL